MKLTRCLKPLTLILCGILLSSPVKAQSILKTLPRGTSSASTTTAAQAVQSSQTTSTSTSTTQTTTLTKATTVAPKVQVLSNSKATITFNFAVPSIGQKQLSGQTVSFVSSKTLDNQVPGTTYPVPSFSYVVQGRIQSARIVQQSGDGILEGATLKSQAESLSDQPIGITPLTGSTSTTAQIPSTYPTSAIEWHYGGMMRGTEISNLKISPYTYNAETKTVRYVQQVTVEVTLNTSKSTAQSLTLGLNQASIFKQIPSNRGSFSKSTNAIGSSGTAKSASLSKTQTKTASTGVTGGVYGGLPVKPKYRFIINTDGVYQIGYFEFQDAKFPQDFFNADPRTFRVFNKGIEVPIIVKGETDGKFNRDDYIEFLAKANRVEQSDASRPDMYNDPYTDENVYYFYWESAATDANKGLRMVDVPGQNRRAISSKSSFNLSGKSFRSTLHFEADYRKDERLSGFFSPFNQEEYSKTRNESDRRDTKFWEEIAFGRSVTYDVTIPNPDLNVSSDPESLRVVAAFHGLSMVYLGGLPQNTARIAIGNPTSPIIAAESSWGTNISSTSAFDSRQDVHIVDVRLPITEQRTFASSGEGVIQISNRDNISIGTSSRVFLFNWLSLTYRRLYRAYNNELTFTAPPNSRPGLYQFEITGFTTPDIEIYKTGIGKMTNFIIEHYSETDDKGNVIPGTFYKATFQDDIVNPDDISYTAIPTSNKKLPLHFEKVGPSNLFEQTVTLQNKLNDYNFIIITSDNFINEDNYQSTDNAVRLYKEYREGSLSQFGESNRVLVATVKTIYDEFNHGIKSPRAIRDFLDYAYHEWSVSPTYILLLGDASRSISSDDIIPTMDIQTLAYGSAAADGWYTMVDGTDESGQLDLLPDMQISRVPARTLGDIKNYLDKLKTYEAQTTSNSGVWKNSLVVVGGETGSESVGSTGVRRDIFITQEDDLANSFINRNFFIKRLNTNLGRNAASGNPTDLFKGGKTDLQQILNNGCVIANFMGHGGGATWSDSQILDMNGVDELNNGNTLPFFLSLTCFTGAFDEPRFFSQGGTLSEKLLLTKGKGGIATIGSSSVGWLINDDIMAQSIWKFVLSEEYQGLSIADMLFRAKIEYYLNNIYLWEQAPSMLFQYGVFGDPALRLNIPSEKNSSGNSVISWNLVSYIGNVGDTLKIKATVDGITTGVGYGQLTDTENLDVAVNSQISFVIQNGKFYQSRNGRLSDTLFVPIPQPVAITPTNVLNFSGGQFKAYVQGTGTDAGKDANGHVKFSTSGAVIYSLTPSRKIETAINLPVSFKVGVDSKEIISSVGVAVKLESPKDGLTYGEVSGWNYRILSATQISKGVYATQDSVPSSLMTKGTRVTYYSYAITASGKYSNTVTKTVVVGELPDVAVYKKSQSGVLQFYDNSSIGFYTKNNSVVIGTEIYNWSAVDANKVVVMFYQNSITNGDPKRSTKPTLVANTVIGSDTISIPAGQKVLATIPVPSSFKLSSTYQIGVRAYLDSTGSNYEQNYENNLSNQQSVVYNLLKVESNSKQIVSLATDVTLTYEANTFSKAGFVKVTKVEGPAITSQPDNQFMRFASQRNGTVVDENYYAYRIQAISSDLTPSKPIKITMKYDGKDPFLVNFPTRREKVAGYYLGENIQRWLKLSTQTKPDTTTVEMESDSLGTFSVMYTSDVSTPIVNLGIDGQYYTKGGYAPRRARIVATVQDQNGVYLSSKFITVIRDNDSSDAVQKRLTIPKATTNANSVGIAYDEEFSVGTHEVSFIFHDANLNRLRTEKMVFVVQNDFGLKVYGNFPNPFKDQTDIAYEIIGGEPASVLEIKIYTVAGRLIKTYNDQTGKVTGFTDKISAGESRRVGLHVYTWDGTDESGTTVANGVYYCRIRANFQGKEKDEILKIARIR